jgi:plasmid stability protein
MGEILIRNLDDEVMASFEWRARMSGRSLEETIRDALAAAAPLTSEERVALSERLREGMPKMDHDVLRYIRLGRDDAMQAEAPLDPKG